MGLLLVGFFLFCLLSQAPAYAVTIVDVAEVSRIIKTDSISDCEWWETIETRTTTTYREPVFIETGPIVDPGVIMPIVYSGDDSLQVNVYPVVRNPCFPDPEDKEAIIPEYCTAELLLSATESSGFVFQGGSSGLPLTFREWMEVSIHYNLVHHNECHVCLSDPTDDPLNTPAPDPKSWILGLTGLVGILLSRRRSREK